MGSGSCVGLHYLEEVPNGKYSQSLQIRKSSQFCEPKDMFVIGEFERRTFIKKFNENLQNLFRLYRLFCVKKLFKKWIKNEEYSKVEKGIIVFLKNDENEKRGKNMNDMNDDVEFLVICHIKCDETIVVDCLLDYLIMYGFFDFIKKKSESKVVSHLLSSKSKEIFMLKTNYNNVSSLNLKKIEFLCLTGYRRLEKVMLFPIFTVDSFDRIPITQNFTRDVEIKNNSGCAIAVVENGCFLLRCVSLKLQKEGVGVNETDVSKLIKNYTDEVCIFKKKCEED